MNKVVKTFLVSVLGLTVLLGNSPAPYIERTTEYSDFTATELTYKGEAPREGDFDSYTTKITNTGTSFIDISECFLKRKVDGQNNYYAPYSGNELIGPGQTHDVEFYIQHSSVNPNDLYDVTVAAYAEEIEEDVLSYSGPTDFGKSSTSYYYKNIKYEQFIYDFTFDVSSTDRNNDYGVIFKVEIKGETRYFVNEYISSYISFYLKEDLQESDFKFVDFYAIKLHTHHYSGPDYVVESILFVLLAISAMILPGLVVAGLIVAIVFLVLGIVKKHKNKKNNIDNKEDNASKKSVVKNVKNVSTKNVTGKVSNKTKK